MKRFTKICALFSEHLILSVIFMEIMGVGFGISLLVNYNGMKCGQDDSLLLHIHCYVP